MTLQGDGIYDKIFRHYIEKMGGSFLIITNDILFYKTFRGCLKTLGLRYDPIHNHSSYINTGKRIRDLLGLYKHVFIIIERNIEGRSCLDELSSLKESFGPKIKIVVASIEINKESTILIYEKGADGVIIKPVSINSFIQKIACTLSPNNRFDEKVDRIEQLLINNKTNDAYELICDIFKEKPDSTIGHMLMGDLHKKRCEFLKAEQAYLKAHDSSKLFLEPFKRLVVLYDEIQDSPKKITYLKKLDKLSPLNYVRKVEMGSTYMDLGQTNDADACFTSAISLAKKEAACLVSKTMMDIGRTLKDKDPKRSLLYMQQAIEYRGDDLSKDDIWMFNDMGICLRREGKIDEAIQYYCKALKLAPTDSSLLYNIGMAHAENKKYNEAIHYFTKSIELDMDILHSSSTVPYNIGLIYCKINMYNEADQMFKIALQVDPTNIKAEQKINEIKSKTTLPL